MSVVKVTFPLEDRSSLRGCNQPEMPTGRPPGLWLSMIKQVLKLAGDSQDYGDALSVRTDGPMVGVCFEVDSTATDSGG